MSPSTITLLFLLFAVVMFVFEKIPLGLTSMIVCCGLVVTGVLDIQEAFAGFIDSNVVLFVAMFIVGGALFETGMANKIGGIVTKFAKSERMLIVTIMVIVGFMSGVLSNTGTAAVLIPVVIGIAAKSGYKRSRLLMPLVFAAAMGGNISLIGAPGNMIAQAGLQQAGLGSFGFFDYGLVGLPILIVGTIFYATIGKRFLPDAPSHQPDGAFEGNDDYSHVPSWKKWTAAIILILTVAAMIFEKQLGVKLYVSAWIGALVLVATNVISETQAVKSIDMKTIMLFAGSMALGDAMVKTGTGSVIADIIVNSLGASPSPIVVLVVIFVLGVFMTNFMSNTATCALLVPIGLSLASQLGFDPKAVLAAIVIASSLAYATPIGMPANTMVYNIAGYSFMDYVKAGLPLIVVSSIVALILLPILFPF